MKKLTTAILFSAIFSTQAMAIENDYRPYVGINYAYDTLNAKGHHAYLNNVSVNLGSTYNKYFGTELFYQYSDRQDFKSGDLSHSQLKGYGLDMLAYLPLGCYGRIAPTATMGIGEYTLTNSYRIAKKQRDHGYGYRFGAGITYHIDNNWSARLMARYIKTDHLQNVDHINEVSLGIRYTFD